MKVRLSILPGQVCDVRLVERPSFMSRAAVKMGLCPYSCVTGVFFPRPEKREKLLET
jgi:hypothetical protein